MQIKNKPICFFDLETTGLNIGQDKIIEICIIKKFYNDIANEELYFKFNPGDIKISAEASSKHGVFNEDLVNEISFSEVAVDILKFIDGCSLAGYNIIQFDIPFIAAEFESIGIKFNYKDYHIIDVFKIWKHYEPRTLEGASQRFLGRSIDDAHQAKSDVIATIDIFEAQYNIWVKDNEESFFDDVISLRNVIDLDEKFKSTEDKKIIFNFGKYLNKTVQEVYATDPNYFKWIINSDFKPDTKKYAKLILNKLSQ